MIALGTSEKKGRYTVPIPCRLEYFLMLGSWLLSNDQEMFAVYLLVRWSQDDCYLILDRDSIIFIMVNE